MPAHVASVAGRGFRAAQPRKSNAGHQNTLAIQHFDSCIDAWAAETPKTPYCRRKIRRLDRPSTVCSQNCSNGRAWISAFRRMWARRTPPNYLFPIQRKLKNLDWGGGRGGSTASSTLIFVVARRLLLLRCYFLTPFRRIALLLAGLFSPFSRFPSLAAIGLDRHSMHVLFHSLEEHHKTNRNRSLVDLAAKHKKPKRIAR